MGLKTFVKISGVNNLTDARYCAGMGVDIIGFNLSPNHEKFVSKINYQEIISWIVGIPFVGELENSSLEEISSEFSLNDFDYIETDRLEIVKDLLQFQKKIIYKYQINSQKELKTFETLLNDLNNRVQIMIVKSKNQSLFDKIDDHLLNNKTNIRLLKGYGITPSDTLMNYSGIELEATSEERPGYKDFGFIMNVLEALEE